MSTVSLSTETGKSVLITRPAARVVAPAMRAASFDGEISLCTDGILRVGVSFFDESLLILNELIEETGNADLLLIYRQAPTMQSLKNLVANRGLTLTETEDGAWVIRCTELS